MDLVRLAGLAFLLFWALRLSKELVIRFLLPPADFSRFKGRWAVVTGASAGIGAGYCRALARRGLNVVLIARRKAKLDELASELERAHGVRTRTVEFDFVSPPEAYERLDAQLADLDVCFLVNNVGGNAGVPEVAEGHTFDSPLAKHEAIMAQNLTPPLRMACLLGRRMLRSRGGGGIMFVSSVTQAISPYWVAYGASKAFMAQMNRSLASELQYTQLQVQLVIPGDVSTELNPRARSLLVPDGDDFAETSVRLFGRGVRICPHPYHALQFFLLESVPEVLALPLTHWVFMHRMRLNKVLRAAKEAGKDR